MATLYDIRERAEALSQKLEAGSITPEEVGQLIVDLTDYTQGMERDGSTLGIGKVYPTLEAMRADTAPVGDNGKPLRRGNLVAIYQESTAQTDPNSGLVCMWTGCPLGVYRPYWYGDAPRVHLHRESCYRD